MDISPSAAKAANSTPLSISLKVGQSYELPSFKFQFELPADARANRTWLCAALLNDAGYIPIQ
jgi:hypothetical protein